MRKSLMFQITLAVAIVIPTTVLSQGRPDAAGSGTVSYEVQIHNLEEQINDLKEDVFASRARLRMIWHQLMEDRTGGSRIVLGQMSRLGGLFNVVNINITLDGNAVFSATREENPAIDSRRRHEILAQPVLPGPHSLVVQAELMGDPHGIFAYMRQYVFTLTSSHSFIVADGKTARVDIILADEGGASLELDERLNVRYEVELSDTVGEIGQRSLEGGSTR